METISTLFIIRAKTITVPSYLVRAEETPVQGEMRIQECSSGDVWHSLSFCDHQSPPALVENIHKTVGFTKRKHDVERQNSVDRKTAGDSAIVNQLTVIKE